MDDLQSEKEQIEEMRAWWSEYGRVIIAGIVIAIGGLIGFNQYTSNKLAAQVAASELFDALAEHLTDGDLDEAESVASELSSNYANTSYAAQSRLTMARLYMDKNRDQDAANVLKELLAMSGNDELKSIGRLRLAHVLLYQDKPQEVADLLEGVEATAFGALYDELLGDAYVALDRHDDAGDAYRRALADPSPTPTVDRALVQMKLSDLPEMIVAEAEPTEMEPIEMEPTEVEPAETEAADESGETG